MDTVVLFNIKYASYMNEKKLEVLCNRFGDPEVAKFQKVNFKNNNANILVKVDLAFK